MFVQGYKCQRCICGIRLFYILCMNMESLHFLYDFFTKGILAKHGNHSAFST